MSDVLTELGQVLEQRKQESADSSYVASLYAKGLNKILEKVGEEATETIIAAKDAVNRAYETTMAEGTTWDISTETDGNFTLSVSSNEFSFAPDDVIFENSFEDTAPTSDRVVEFTFTFTASAVADIEESMAFGRVILTERDGKAPDAHITVTVNLNQPTGFTTP